MDKRERDKEIGMAAIDAVRPMSVCVNDADYYQHIGKAAAEKVYEIDGVDELVEAAEDLGENCECDDLGEEHRRLKRAIAKYREARGS